MNATSPTHLRLPDAVETPPDKPNLAAMVDILFTMLFAMLCQVGGVALSVLPAKTTGEGTSAHAQGTALRVEILADGTLLLDGTGRIEPRPSLDAALGRLRAAALKRPVTVVPDAATPYAHVLPVLNALQQSALSVQLGGGRATTP